MVLGLVLSACVPQASVVERLQTMQPTMEDLITPTPVLAAGVDIHDIQGAGHVSPMAGQTVTNVTGVVTALRADGFYMQGLNPDNDPATSEGIFVFTKLPPKPKVGDWVAVDGVVDEFLSGDADEGYLSVTELKDALVTVIETGQAQPQPVILGEGGRALPDVVIDDDDKTSFDALQDGLDFYESLECMLVQVNQARVVGASNAYKEIVVVADGGKHATVLSERGALVLREEDFNPERILLDDGLRPLPVAKVGDWFEQPVIGILDYRFGNYRIQPIVRLSVKKGGLMAEATSPAKPDELTIVTYNLENLDAMDDARRFEMLAEHITKNLLNPDILILVEVQDGDGILDSGMVDATETYQRIVDAVKAVDGPLYEFREIAPENHCDGGETGGNIRVGFLFRPDRVQFVDRVGGDAVTSVMALKERDEVLLSFSPGRVKPQDEAFVDSRKPLAAEFLWGQQRLIVIANHFNSKSGDMPLYGETQPPLLSSVEKRIKQATIVNDFVQEILTLDPQAWVVVAGDLNDFQFSASVRALKGDVLVDLIEMLPEEEQYTFVFQGNAQVLDHVLVSPAMQPFVCEVDIVHINAEFPAGDRFSDHDPVLARFGKVP
jgi:predicted extracellular nuclease